MPSVEVQFFKFGEVAQRCTCISPLSPFSVRSSSITRPLSSVVTPCQLLSGSSLSQLAYASSWRHRSTGRARLAQPCTGLATLTAPGVAGTPLTKSPDAAGNGPHRARSCHAVRFASFGRPGQVVATDIEPGDDDDPTPTARSAPHLKLRPSLLICVRGRTPSLTVRQRRHASRRQCSRCWGACVDAIGVQHLTTARRMPRLSHGFA